jgi:hypothetical protein
MRYGTIIREQKNKYLISVAPGNHIPILFVGAENRASLLRHAVAGAKRWPGFLYTNRQISYELPPTLAP